MRHGSAHPLANTDEERPLVLNGQHDSSRMAKYLRQQLSKFDLVFTSPYLRALQTYHIVGEEFFKPDHQFILDELVPDADPARCGDSLLAYCAQYKIDNALVVSHLPLVDLLVADLCCNGITTSFSTSSVACLKIDLDNWQGKILWFKSPHDIAIE